MYKVILFFEFLKEHKNILEKLDIHDLNLETLEDQLIPIAKEQEFDITAKDIFRFLNEYSAENNIPLDDEILDKVAGGEGNFNRMIAASFIAALIGFTGFSNATQVYAMNNGGTSISQSGSVKSVKTPKSVANNTLSKKEIEYYQEKIGDEYKFVSNEGMSGSFATAYKLEDKNGNQFVLKIANNPQDIEGWLTKQKAAAEKIKKYYKDYKGNLKITNYVKFGEDFVIEENLGNQIGRGDTSWESFLDEEISKFVNDMAEFLRYTHHQERGTVEPLEVGFSMFTLEDAINYYNDEHALSPQDLTMLRTLMEDFKHRDTSDEITSLIHSDIRSQNIVYNSRTKQFGLIDFESLETNGKNYYGFTSKTFASNGIPYDLLSRIADRYNEISDIKVSKEKIKLFHKVGTFYEMATNAKYRLHMSGDDLKKAWNEQVKVRIERIDHGFGE